jgi:RimJ/RimL family protein N-acetyltransferase
MNSTPETNQIVFLKGRHVTLRPPAKADAAIMTRWINDPDVRQFVTTSYPIDEDAEAAYLVDANKPGKNVFLVIEVDGRPIGTMGLHNINLIDRTCTTGTIIGEKDCWGKGYGTDAKMALLEYAFDSLGLRKIHSSVIAYNKRSLAYSLKCGYIEEGRRRQRFFKKGRYHDEILLGILRKEWQPRHKLWKAGKL